MQRFKINPTLPGLLKEAIRKRELVEVKSLVAQIKSANKLSNLLNKTNLILTDALDFALQDKDPFHPIVYFLASNCTLNFEADRSLNYLAFVYAHKHFGFIDNSEIEKVLLAELTRIYQSVDRSDQLLKLPEFQQYALLKMAATSSNKLGGYTAFLIDTFFLGKPLLFSWRFHIQPYFRNGPGVTIACNFLTMVVVESKDPFLLHELLKRGMNPNILDSEGFSPLLRAVENRNDERTIKLLLEFGAIPDIPFYSKDSEGAVTPFKLTFDREKKELIEPDRAKRKTKSKISLQEADENIRLFICENNATLVDISTTNMTLMYIESIGQYLRENKLNFVTLLPAPHISLPNPRWYQAILLALMDASTYYCESNPKLYDECHTKAQTIVLKETAASIPFYVLSKLSSPIVIELFKFAQHNQLTELCQSLVKLKVIKYYFKPKDLEPYLEKKPQQLGDLHDLVFNNTTVNTPEYVSPFDRRPALTRQEVTELCLELEIAPLPPARAVEQPN